MKKIIYAALLMPLLLFIGCNEDDKAPEPIITLGQTEVIFSNANQEKAVSVTVDTDHKFVATWSNEGAIWGEVVASEDGSGVTIYVSGNTGDYSRVGSVRISTVGDVATKFISVHQNGKNFTLDILPETLLFNQLAASKFFEVTTDAKYWSVSGETDWLTISMDRTEFKEVFVTVTENVLFSDRVARLTITAGGDKKEIVITQTAAIDIIMPFLDFSKFSDEGGNASDSIKKFELARGSQMITGGDTYRTLSPNFPEIRYTLNWRTKDLYMVIMEPNNWPVLKSPELHSLIIEQGFEYIYTLEAEFPHAYYWRAYDRTECVIEMREGQLQFYSNSPKPIDPAQTEDFATFTEIPKGFIDWSATKADINTWELANGGSFKVDLGVTQGYEQFVYSTNYNNPRKEFERAYWFYIGDGGARYMQTLLMYTDFTLAYYESPSDGLYRLTREFKTLMADNGYKEITGGTTQYLNTITNIRIFPTVVGYDPNSTGNEVPTLWITLMKGDFKQ